MTRAVPWNSMEFHGTSSAPISMTRAVPWNSMEFHGTSSAPISMTRAVPWNSMELQVRQFRWHEQFHGIPRNLWCANFDDTSSSMEFHGTWGEPISMTRAVPWNSMELKVRQFRWHEQFHGIPWNSIFFYIFFISLSPTDVLLLIFALYHMHFRHYSLRIKISFEIPFQCSLFWSKSSMELSPEIHGTFWTTFEQHPWYHGIPWNLSNKTSSSMEFCPDPKFHGNPWNFFHTPEFHGIPWNFFEVPWNSMEFHGTW